MAACANSAAHMDKEKNAFSVQKANGIAMNIKKVSVVKGEKSQDVLKVTITGENQTAEEKDFDAMLVKAVNKQGKALKMYPANSLGLLLKSDQKATGDAYFELTGDLPIKITYQNESGQNLASWSIKNIDGSD